MFQPQESRFFSGSVHCKDSGEKEKLEANAKPHAPAEGARKLPASKGFYTLHYPVWGGAGPNF